MKRASFSSLANLNKTSEKQSMAKNKVSCVSSSLSSMFSAITSIGCEVSSYWWRKVYRSILLSETGAEYYRHLMTIATNYEQWASAATMLDNATGSNCWKAEKKSNLYDHCLLETRLEQLNKCRETGDYDTLTFLLRTSLSRNIGGMGNAKLYEKTHFGTKRLIENYIEEVVRDLNIICDLSKTEFSTKEKYEFFINTRQAFGRTALLLSGGATFGLNHIGVIKVLSECKLIPRIVSGASSGSIVAAMLCTRTDEELPVLLSPGHLNLNFFEHGDEKTSIFMRMLLFIKHGVIFEVSILVDTLRGFLGDITFLEAYNRTRRVLNIPVSSATKYEMPRLLNYITTPNILVWSAVAASCAVPIVYRSAPLLAKDKSGKIVPWNPSGQRWIDGSVERYLNFNNTYKDYSFNESDLPMNRLAELFNVNHFIVCQGVVNPHVIPFLSKFEPDSLIGRTITWTGQLLYTEFEHRINQLIDLNVFPYFLTKIRGVLSQKYTGDITIVPDIAAKDYAKLLQNPSFDLMMECTLRGENATWPKISIIRNHCQIELCIDEIIYRLRLRLLYEQKCAATQVLKKPVCFKVSLKRDIIEEETNEESSDRGNSPNSMRDSGLSMTKLKPDTLLHTSSSDTNLAGMGRRLSKSTSDTK